MVLWIGIAALLAIPVYPQGEAARSNAALARQAIRTGTVVLHERWESCWGVSECDATAYFDERRYRLDVHEHSGLGSISSATNGRLIDPVRMAFDGEMVLDRL